jgi:hypothetical protein
MRMIVIWRTHFARGKRSLLEMTVPDSSDRQIEELRADWGRNLSDEEDEEVVKVKSVKGKGKANAEGKGKKQAE